MSPGVAAAPGAAWSPKNLHVGAGVGADADGPLARLAIVGESQHSGEEDEEDGLDDEAAVLGGLLTDPEEEPRKSPVPTVGWGSPGRTDGSPRYEHAIGSMWDEPGTEASASQSGGNGSAWASAGAGGSVSAQMSGMSISGSNGGSGGDRGPLRSPSGRAPKNALETAAAWPAVEPGGSTASDSPPSPLGGSHLHRSPPRSSIGANSQVPNVQSWATGRLVGSPSSPTSPDGRDLGEDELPDWLASALGEMGGEQKDDEPTSPVAQYLAQETPTGPRRSDLKLAGRRGPASPPHPALASLGRSLAGNGIGGGGSPEVAPPMMMHQGHASSAAGGVSPVQWAAEASFPPPPAISGAGAAGSLSGGLPSWGVDSSGLGAPRSGTGSNGGFAGANSGAAGRGAPGLPGNRGWTVGPHRANIV